MAVVGMADIGTAVVGVGAQPDWRSEPASPSRPQHRITAATMPIPTTTATVPMRMGMAIRMAIAALTTDTAVTIRIAALTTPTIAPIIDMPRIADIGSR